MNKTRGSTDNWEAGKLGLSRETAVVASAEETAAIERAVGMQLISMRLPKTLIGMLKEIANHHGIGYQPMVRDLLTRFAKSEIKIILAARLEEARKAKDCESDLKPVSEFLERERKRA